jgi:predicted nucleic acid-binding protein
LRSRGEQFAISAMTVTELLSFPRITLEESFLIERWMRSLVIADVDVSIARYAAGLRREHRITTVDGVIAATTHILNAKLVTNDQKLLRLKKIETVNL